MTSKKENKADNRKIWLVDFSLKHRAVVLGFWAFVFVASLYLLVNMLLSPKTSIDNSVGIWFMKDDPELITYEKFNKEFGEKEWTILLLETDTVFSQRFLNDLDKITRRIEKVKHIQKVVSLTNLLDSRVGKDSSLRYLQIYPANDTNEIITAGQLREFKERIIGDTIYENSLIHKNDSKRVILLFQNDNFLYDIEPYRIEMIDSVKNIVKAFPNVRKFSLAGTSVVNAELNRSSKHDVYVFYTLVTIFINICGFFLLKNRKDLFILLTVVTYSAFPPMALLVLFNIPFNMVTVILPPVLISLSVCDVAHVINGFHFERKYYEPYLAVNTAIWKIWTPCLWTSLITIIGLLSLSLSTVFPIWQLGVLGAVGIFIAWFITMTLVPILLVFFWPQKTSADSLIHDGSREVGLYSKRLLPLIGKYRWLWITISILLLFPLIGIPKLRVDTNYTKFFRSRAEISHSYSKIKDVGFGQNPVSIILKYPKEKTFYSGNYFPLLLNFEDDLKKDKSIIKLLSVSDLIDRIDIAFNGKYVGPPRIKKYSENKISQLFLMGEMSNNEDIANYTNELKNQLQIVVMTSYMSSKELGEFKKRIYKRGKIFPEEVQISVTGTTVLWSNMDKQIVGTQMDSVFIITIIFVFLLPFIFKSVKLGIIGVLINCLPLAITFGLMGLLDIKINMATALIGGISVGSTIDSTIFFINRFRLGIKEGLSWDKAVDNAIISVGDGIIITSLILAGGFFCMSISSFLPTAQLGILITFSILVSLFLDLIINPIILRFLKPQIG